MSFLEYKLIYKTFTHKPLQSYITYTSSKHENVSGFQQHEHLLWYCEFFPATSINGV
jgi:hypothetical protein